jgi:hypothetical protein
VDGAMNRPIVVNAADVIIGIAADFRIGAFPLRIILTAANPEVTATAAATSVASTSVRLDCPGVTAKHQAITAPPTSTVAESSQNASRSRPDRPGCG